MYKSIATALLLLFTTPAMAQSTDDVERLAGEGVAKMLQALDLLMRTVPQYAAPEVQPNGDIIIRRVHPEDRPKRAPKEEGDNLGHGTET